MWHVAREESDAVFVQCLGLCGCERGKEFPFGFTHSLIGTCQIPMADGLAAARKVSAVQSLRLLGRGLYDEIGSRFGRDPRMIPLIAGRDELALAPSDTPQADLSALNPDGVPFRNEIAARFALRAARFRPVKSAHTISCPLLVIVCEADELTPPQAAVQTARRAPRGELVRLPGYHYALYGDSGRAETITVQLAFLERHLAAAAPIG